MQTSMHEAKSKLSQLVELALTGEEVVIARAGKPAVKLVPFKDQKERVFGQFKGQVIASDDFDSKEVNDDIANCPP
ncbi:MAG: type II toxin-antitoxin system prevent-host-death family antitoxin [Alteromonas sp.]|jgi:prevent-host-death family protein|uniref:type II toxin-antitoxin system Phd/YefM family antitoxin n=1 Tax=Alteromonas sp. TaxID=232 RepID=UPI0032D9214C